MIIPQIYPLVTSIYRPTELGRGPFEKGCPTGVTVHHTADRDLDRVRNVAMDSHVGYHLLIDREGLVHQTTYMDRMVAHAGNAVWRGKSPNREHIAISLLSWGRLKNKDHTWTDKILPAEEIEVRAGNLDDVRAPWDAATPVQEKCLIDVLKWFVSCGLDPDYICGHDECALPRGRKDDPGGVLSLKMSGIRSLLQK